MKKLLCTILILSLSIPLVCGCSDKSSGVETETNPMEQKNEIYTFTDDLEREVKVSSHDRTAALLGSFADVWILAGGAVCATADDAWEDYNLPLSEDAVNLGMTKNLSLEKLLGAAPDFVIASSNTPTHLEWRQSLEDAGITVAYFDVSDFDDYLRMFKICTDITGDKEAYETYGENLQKQISEILERNKDKESQSVLVMRASAASIRVKNSEGTVLGAALKDFGCNNIADDDDSLLENLSVESVALQNPNKIFFIQSGDDEEGMKKNIEKMFRENPLWNELDAVKNGNVYYMDKLLYGFKPNGRWGESYAKLEEILYGES